VSVNIYMNFIHTFLKKILPISSITGQLSTSISNSPSTVACTRNNTYENITKEKIDMITTSTFEKIECKSSGEIVSVKLDKNTLLRSAALRGFMYDCIR
jgi:hypothetical protein